MTDSLKNIFFSTRLMAFLFISFAVAMAVGTFVESEYSTETARIWIYNAWWFEGIMLFFVINFSGNIFRYRLYKKEKWAVLTIHLSFILIILGAFITRYISFEGMMPIREGETENVFYSQETYLTVFADGEINGEPRRKVLKDKILITPEAMAASLPWKSDFNGTPFTVSYKGFLSHAKEGLVPAEEGAEYLKIVEAGGGSRHDHYLKSGEVENIHNVLFALNKPTPGAINISTTDSVYTLESPFEGDFMRMADQFKGNVVKDSVQPLMLRSLYNTAGMQFVIPEPVVKGNYGIVAIPEQEQTPNDLDALLVEVSSGNLKKEVKLLGGQGTTTAPEQLKIGNLDFYLSYGSVKRELPFSIRLNDFIAEKYPGTEKGYSSYMSKVTVEDERPFDYDIFMNHVLDHKGYRFFQASFSPDEKGTVLSVNHDFWGTWITYIGYFLLYLGLLGIMFYGKTRFKSLAKSLDKVKAKKAALTSMMLLFLISGLNAQEEKQQNPSNDHDHEKEALLPSQQEVSEMIERSVISKAHAEKFGQLVIQDDGGRMKPLHTFASELVRKISKQNSYKDMDANQVFLSMLQTPSAWYNVDFIYITKKNDSIRKIIGVPEGQKYVKATDFFDKEGNYKLAPYLENAYATNTPNQFQKGFREFDLKLGLLNRAFSGEILKIYPLPDDENNKWISAVAYRSGQFEVKDSLYANFIDKSLRFYLMSLQRAKATGDYATSDKLVAAFKQNQRKIGAEVMPSENKIKAEILYNKVNIFEKLLVWFMILGIVMFFAIITQIFKDTKVVRWLIMGCKAGIVILFLAHTAGLGFRWYISGHAPWSDAYESVIYVAWATMAMGLAFGRKSDLTIASTAFVTAIILFGAHMNWLDPAIANLQPVLNSYWLMIHVSVIVGSYGPFTLGMILGVTSLLLMLLTTTKNKAKMDLTIKELTIINELALTVGLIMLTIGNFLGGQWANESWGRYWGWDPKETWALISIMVYAFVVHMRLVPGLRDRWLFNFMSIVAFASIMMTYFGVNFYLTGLHSYASGDKVITPGFVWYSVAFVVVLGILSYWRYAIYYRKEKNN